MSRRRPTNTQNKPEDASKRSRVGIILGASLVIGLFIRIVMICLSPRYGYVQDHDDLARWALQAADDGVLSLYDHPPKTAELQVWLEDQWAIARHDLDRLCNYPPLCAYMLDISGHLIKALRTDRLLNTTESRWAIGFWSILFDALLALGCAALVRACQGASSSRTQSLAMIFGWLVPPFWLVSCLWGQVDTWVLAPMVWTVAMMIEGRWIAAGLWFAAAIGIKPQVAALVPVWGAAVLMARPITKPLLALVVSGVATFVIALPFMLHSGAAWWVQSYQANLFEHSKGTTTLMAFNIWYLDCLFTGSVDESRTWMGAAKSAWGQAALGLALLLGLIWTIRRFGQDRRGLLIYSAIVMLAFVMLPTRVHERFIVLVIPFLIGTTLVWRRGWLGISILLIVATAQVAWPIWLKVPAVDWEQFERTERAKYDEQVAKVQPGREVPSFEAYIRPFREDFVNGNRPVRPFEWAFALLGIVGTAVAAVELVTKNNPNNSSPQDDT